MSVSDLFSNRAVFKPNFYAPIRIVVVELDPDPIPVLIVDLGLKSWSGADGIERESGSGPCHGDRSTG